MRAISIGSIFVLVCALKLVQAGEEVGVYTYPGIVEKALGPCARLTIQIFLAFC